MARVVLVEVCDEHIRHLAGRMREDDVYELLAAGQTPEEALRSSVAGSVSSHAAYIDGDLVAIFGVAPVTLLGGCAVAWCLTSRDAEKHWRTFARESAAVIRLLSEVWPVLMNYVDARYERAIRWLRWLGFRVDPPAPYGPNRAPFCLVVREV